MSATRIIYCEVCPSCGYVISATTEDAALESLVEHVAHQHPEEGQ